MSKQNHAISLRFTQEEHKRIMAIINATGALKPASCLRKLVMNWIEFEERKLEDMGT